MESAGLVTSVMTEYMCLLCSKLVKHDPMYIASHMKNNHQMTLNKYHHKYVENEEARNDEIMQEIPESENARSEKNQHSWAHGCKWTCHSCGDYEAPCYFTINSHVRARHNSTLKIMESAGLITSVVSEYKCLICSKSIKHDNSVIGQHMKSNHQMTLNDYYQKYVENKEERDHKIREENPENVTTVKLSGELATSSAKVF